MSWCHSCGADQRLTLQQFLLSRPIPAQDKMGNFICCVVCAEKLPKGKPGRPSMTCSNKKCRSIIVALKGRSRRR